MNTSLIPSRSVLRRASLARTLAVLFILSAAGARAATPDFAVTSPSFAYTINSASGNPSITVIRGELYTFTIATASNHPFQILNSANVTNNNIFNGTITWRVPTNAVNYAYECSFHHFSGTIVTVPPPVVLITKFTATNSLVLRSTGTTNYNVLPEFKTNVTSTNWFALTVQSNNFLSGTNETFCGRPPGSNVFIRIKAVRK